ncbi:hypothetical protein CV102_22120 [Natronococcus pandeyae]|uniref:Uncharacterized protein n=1 Tax=Natronococcus pandeyae TaxID=2055836 RepID=A0A8J8PX74_9EURY|nr:hypothetical protein [Natronococcus pandeyae]TYL36521.1 hypothetical protein CV102_22120 [Natronococcus pandeyae]
MVVLAVVATADSAGTARAKRCLHDRPQNETHLDSLDAVGVIERPPSSQSRRRDTGQELFRDAVEPSPETPSDGSSRVSFDQRKRAPSATGL